MSGAKLNADGTVTEMCETYAFPFVGPVLCDFCGAPYATPQRLPDLRSPAAGEDVEEPLRGMMQWGHPLTGNVCRECAVKQMVIASDGRLVERVTSDAVRCNCPDGEGWVWIEAGEYSGQSFGRDQWWLMRGGKLTGQCHEPVIGRANPSCGVCGVGLGMPPRVNKCG